VSWYDSYHARLASISRDYTLIIIKKMRCNMGWGDTGVNRSKNIPMEKVLAYSIFTPTGNSKVIVDLPKYLDEKTQEKVNQNRHLLNFSKCKSEREVVAGVNKFMQAIGSSFRINETTKASKETEFTTPDGKSWAYPRAGI
jgi:hypothetical protein